MTTLISHNVDNSFAMSSPAHKVRKIVRDDQTGGTAYQNILKHSTGSRIIGIPKHLRLQMQQNRGKQKEQLARQKMEEEEDTFVKVINKGGSKEISYIPKDTRKKREEEQKEEDEDEEPYSRSKRQRRSIKGLGGKYR